MAADRTLPDFRRLSVAVAGDLVADHYLYAQPRRLSREAPVMVLRYDREDVGAGGAANVARNLRALEAHVRMFGAVGKDAAGRDVLRRLEAEGIDTSGVIVRAGYETPTKTRVLAAEPRRSLQQVLRIDREPRAPLADDARGEIAARLAAEAGSLDALIVSDYEYGAVGDELGSVASDLAGGGRVVVLDPRQELAAFHGATAWTPNQDELARFVRADAEEFDDVKRFRAAAHEMLARARCRYLLVTRGNLGMALFGADLPEEGIAVEASGSGEVTDVCGAGDTAAAVFALALAAGCDAPSSMALANAAAGVVVMEHGAAVCPASDLFAALATAPRPVRLSAGPLAR